MSWPPSCAEVFEDLPDIYECFEGKCKSVNVRWDDANKSTPYSSNVCKCSEGKTSVNGIVDITKECCK